MDTDKICAAIDGLANEVKLTREAIVAVSEKPFTSPDIQKLVECLTVLNERAFHYLEHIMVPRVGGPG